MGHGGKKGLAEELCAGFEDGREGRAVWGIEIMFGPEGRRGRVESGWIVPEMVKCSWRQA